jgi:hypothetical protein
MSGIRPGVVNEVILALARDTDAASRIRDVEATGASREEKQAAGNLLAKSAVDALIAAGVLSPAPAPSLLGFTWHAARRLGAQGLAILWLSDQLAPAWADPNGTRTLADVLKVESAARVAALASELHLVGLCELCEHHDDENDG